MNPEAPVTSTVFVTATSYPTRAAPSQIDAAARTGYDGDAARSSLRVSRSST